MKLRQRDRLKLKMKGRKSSLVQEAAHTAIPEETLPRTGCASWFVRAGRLRSGWRVLLYVIAARLVDLISAFVIGVVLAVTVGAALARQGLPPSEIPSRIVGMLENFVQNPALALGGEGERLVAVLVLVWLFRRIVDRKSFRSLGFELTSGWWQEALGGFGFVIASWAVIFLLSLGLGGAIVVGSAADSGNWVGVAGGLAFGLVLNVMVGVTEETDARGYILQNLAEGIRFWPAVFVSALYFGLLHLLNPGAGLGSTAGIFVAGVLLALGYYATRRMWFPIGMHAAWNFAEGPLFGFLVSGLNMGGLVQLKITGPDWLMGGAFGPEAGALAVGVEIAMIIVLYVWGRGRQRGREALNSIDK